MDSDSSITLSALKFVNGDKQHICRLCFGSTENEEISLEDTVRVQKYYFDDNVTFVEMFDNLAISVEPLLPQVLCTECATATINSFLFQKLCEYSNAKWSETLSRLQESLRHSELINPTVKTAYIIINKTDNVMFTSRKFCTVKTKKFALSKMKNIMTNRSKYAKIKLQNSIIICEECGENCHSKSHLSSHMRLHKNYSAQNIPCPKCAKYFPTKVKLESHQERIHYPKTVQCSQCAKMFSTEKILKEHEKIHHVAVICKLCFVQFPSKNALRAHLDKHDVNKCERCSKSFINKHTFKRHLKICGNPDSKLPIFFCDICSKGYARKNSLRSHLKTDHGFGQVLSCNWCNKKFDVISRLKYHIVKHTRERNFSCEQCGNKFVTQAALVYHTRLHTGEKPFPCDMCDENFLSASRRMEHKRRKHFEPSRECTVCHAKFVTGNQLRKHERRHFNPTSKLYVPITKQPDDDDDDVFFND